MRVAGVVLIVAGVVVGVLLWLAAGQRYDDAVADLAPVPLGCTTTLAFERTGTYTFFVETKGEIGEIDGDCVTDGRSYDVDAEDTPRVSLALVDERGDEVDLDRVDGPSYDRSGRRGVGVRTVGDRRGRRLRADGDGDVRRGPGRRARRPRPVERGHGAAHRRHRRVRARHDDRAAAAPRAREPPPERGTGRAGGDPVADRAVPRRPRRSPRRRRTRPVPPPTHRGRRRTGRTSHRRSRRRAEPGPRRQPTGGWPGSGGPLPPPSPPR